ncbi:hypothetical protein P171DRAFT_506015 [Karstenula rhodostoma CBS 690.94]|uniref:Uncharacterized protein n=1 Tax=Karstenula rhodostoma CBS 690.94 TaxID=1392251 RepID=A0A9P4U5F1_9PLEO|nr:hypothetical protein P171DRAFT_506015 [Karstenula rhodostoma CBS 690.94]
MSCEHPPKRRGPEPTSPEKNARSLQSLPTPSFQHPSDSSSTSCEHPPKRRGPEPTSPEKNPKRLQSLPAPSFQHPPVSRRPSLSILPPPNSTMRSARSAAMGTMPVSQEPSGIYGTSQAHFNDAPSTDPEHFAIEFTRAPPAPRGPPAPQAPQQHSRLPLPRRELPTLPLPRRSLPTLPISQLEPPYDPSTTIPMQRLPSSLGSSIDGGPMPSNRLGFRVPENPTPQAPPSAPYVPHRRVGIQYSPLPPSPLQHGYLSSPTRDGIRRITFRTIREFADNAESVIGSASVTGPNSRFIVLLTVSRISLEIACSTEDWE